MTARIVHISGPTRSIVRRAFTVVELLVVISIIVIVLTIATPAFRSMIYSSERSLAFNSVEAAVASARDLSLRSAGGDDGAVVFLYDSGGRMRIIPAVRVGSLPVSLDAGVTPNAPKTRMDVFAPVADVPAIEMPLHWHVRGYAPARSTVDMRPNGTEVSRWYNGDTCGGRNPRSAGKDERNWVFPESGFYASDLQVPSGGASRPGISPTARQSFIVRFDARTGGLSDDRSMAIVLDPRPSTKDRIGGERPNADQVWLRVDRSEDLVRWARSVLEAPPFNPRTGALRRPPFRDNIPDGQPEYLGIDSNDTVLVKPVTRIAVYDERRLAADLGARSLNAATGTIYAPVAADGSGDQKIRFDGSLFRNGFDADVVRRNINSWIEGDTNFDRDIDDDDVPEARIYLVRPLTGELTEVLR